MEQVDAHVKAHRTWLNQKFVDALAPYAPDGNTLIGEVVSRSIFPMILRPGVSSRRTLKRKLLGGVVSQVVDVATWKISEAGDRIKKIGDAMIPWGTNLLIRWERWLSGLPTKGED